MNKAYVIWPLVGLLVFGAFYWNASKGFAEKQHQEEVRKQEEKKARILREAELRKKAIEDAIAAQQVRMAARAAKEKREEEEKKARADLIDRRNRAFDDVNKRLRPQLDRLKGDAEEIMRQLTALDQEKKQHADEAAFLLTYVRQAEANVKTYLTVLDQIAAAEKARADAEAAAKKKS
jgi:colicin import membrane protein